MSPLMHSRNLNGLAWILSDEGHNISFPIAHEVHIKLLDFENLASFKSWLVQFSIIFRIIPIPGCLGVNFRSRMYQHSRKSPYKQYMVWA
jgi:hypothetical protein